MEESNPELESFRQQWRAEVTARGSKTSTTNTTTTTTSASHPKRPREPKFDRLASSHKPEPVVENDDDGDYKEVHVVQRTDGHATGLSEAVSEREPTSALEHYEKAVEMETQGSLGESLSLYRKANRMDDQVDKVYKNKHFPPSSFPSKPTKVNPSNAAVTVPNPAHHSLHGPPQTIKALIATFAGLTIEPTPPAIEGTPAPLSLLAELPEEILIHILTDLATQDITAFVKLALVCKRLAFLVSTEEQIWKKVYQGSEFGFGAMHYQWQRKVLWGELEDDILDSDEEEIKEDFPQLPALTKDEITSSLLLNSYKSSWHQMYRLRPRIRFNGCYISTVNYIRAGQASASQVTWSSPVHIVTYYRYLRFFRDGTAISLLTTDKPNEVIHHLTPDLLDLHRGGAHAHLPSIVMQNGLRGRWRLSTTTDNPEAASLKDAEGDVFVETEGVNEKYTYRMQFSLRTAGKTSLHNKLVWQGFWNYNMLTDDTGEFTLNHDKSFFFSRVKSYGLGA